MTHRHTDWLNANKYTPEERRNMCLDLMGEAQYWDSAQYVRHMHDSTKRPFVGLTNERVYEIYERVQREVNEHWENGGTTMMFPIALYQAIEQALKEKNT